MRMELPSWTITTSLTTKRETQVPSCPRFIAVSSESPGVKKNKTIEAALKPRETKEEAMGNCQAGEAATVAIQQPSGRVERFYWQLKANEVMAANPGHYVAVIVTAVSSTSESPVRYLKLLRPDDTLHIGHVYRLVSFEDVLRDFGSKKKVRLSKLLVKPEDKRRSNHQRERKEREGEDGDCGGEDSRQENSSCSMTVEAEQQQEEIPRVDNSSFDIRRTGGSVSRHGQWRPTLQSIAEAGL